MPKQIDLANCIQTGSPRGTAVSFERALPGRASRLSECSPLFSAARWSQRGVLVGLHRERDDEFVHHLEVVSALRRVVDVLCELFVHGLGFN